MAMNCSIKATLSVPINGWMRFDLQTPDVQFTFQVSYTPNDFLDELLTALALAAQGVAGVALAHTEPVVIELAFSPDPQNDLLTLKVTEYPDWRRRTGEGRPLFAGQGTAESIVVAFWRAVRRLQSEVTADEYREGMQREFPTEKIQRLSELLDKA